MKTHVSLLILLAFQSSLLAAAETQPFNGKASNYHGYTRYDFKLNDTPAVVVTPKVAAKGSPWIWRAEFFDHQPGIDLALIEKGWHLAYLNVGNTFGCPSAMDSSTRSMPS